MTELLNLVNQFASDYLEKITDRNVAPTPDAVRRLAELNIPLPDQASAPRDVLTTLNEIGSPATVASTGGRYFGFVTGGALPVSVAANWLAGAWDQNSFCFASSPVAVALETIALQWLQDILGLPAGCGGAFVTGATMANFTGLAAARHAVLEKAGWDVEARGIFGAPPINVIVGEEAHPTLHKALGLLGLGRERVIRVPVDDQGRMRADAFPSITAPAIVCIQAGNVNSGAFDPAAEICKIARESDAWVHVDGAFGLWAAAAPQRRHLTAGLADAHSWATDAHKWLNVPYDCGLALVRDESALGAAMSIQAAYLPDKSRREPMHFTPEASRRMRGIEVWTALRTLGRKGVADLIERTCRLAKRFAEGFQQAGYAVLNDVVLNQVLVSFGNSETTRKVIAAIQTEGTCWCGETVWQGKTAMRISVSSWATTEEDVDRSLKAMLRIAAQYKP